MIIDSKKISDSKLKKSIKKGEIIIFPSDGVYIIGCSIDSSSAGKLREIGSGIAIPTSKQWITSNFKSKKNYLQKIPGPFVYIFDLKKTSRLKENIRIAIPSHEFTKKMQKAGKTIFAVQLDARNIRNISKKIKDLADIIIDDGFLEGNSLAVIDLREKVAKIVR